jgi:hypothetical protein
MLRGAAGVFVGLSYKFAVRVILAHCDGIKIYCRFSGSVAESDLN